MLFWWELELLFFLPSFIINMFPGSLAIEPRERYLTRCLYIKAEFKLAGKGNAWENMKNIR